MEQAVESFKDVSIIDLSLLRENPSAKSLLIKKIGIACQKHGFFHVINHGVPDSVIQDALEVNAKFFEMEIDEKKELMSDDKYKAVRFGRVQDGELSRDFLKLYAHPLDQYVNLWPRSPPHYREKVGMYSTLARKLGIELFEAIMESLHLDETHLLKERFEQGFQMLGINYYPPSLAESNLKAGITPHTDHSIITILLQSAPGLEVIDRVDGADSWKTISELKGSLQVLVGDHLEVISNGLYKSVLHRAVPSCLGARLSIANLHSLGMDDIVEPAAKLDNGKNPIRYRGSTLRDFINHISSKNSRAFIDTIKY